MAHHSGDYDSGVRGSKTRCLPFGLLLVACWALICYTQYACAVAGGVLDAAEGIGIFCSPFLHTFYKCPPPLVCICVRNVDAMNMFAFYVCVCLILLWCM